MKNLAMISMALIFALTPFSAQAKWKGKEPCSGKKGGIKTCTANGKFICVDGSISSSKKICH